LSSFTIKSKILVLTTLSLIVLAITLAIVSISYSKDELIKTSYDKLTYSRESKKKQIDDYFEQRIKNINFLSKDIVVQNIVKELASKYDELKILHNKPFPVYDDQIQNIIKKYEKFFTNYVKQYGYYDVFIICADHGHVMYTQAKESDFGANLKDGFLKDSGLGEIWKKVIKTKRTTFVDMKPYKPSNNEPALFIGTPIFNDKTFEAILVFQISDKQVNNIMNFRQGYGKTQEDYLVGQDFLMRSDSYLSPSTHSLRASFKNHKLGTCKTEATKKALKGETDTKIVIDYNNNPVLSAFSPLKIGDDLNWAIMSEIDEAEVLIVPNNIRNTIIVVTISLLTIILTIMTIIINHSVVNPILKFETGLLHFLKYLHIDSKQLKMLDDSSNDEIGEMAKAINKNIVIVKRKLIEERKKFQYELDKKTKELKELNQTLEDKVLNEVDKNMQKEILLLEQSKMAQMGEMIGNIAHQWRQPLSTISTVASGIQVKYQFGILEEDELPAQMTQIVEKTEYLSNTIETFRNFLKEEKEERVAVIQDRIDVSLKIVGVVLDDHDIKLVNNMNYEKPINVNIVLGELTEVIINIINNAKDALIDNKIKNPTIEVSLEDKKDKVILTIEDNAGGIPDDVLPKIFNPYFTTKHQSQGTGLGLHMSYTIITKSLNGNLYAKNTKKGAKFFIELPIYKK